MKLEVREMDKCEDIYWKSCILRKWFYLTLYSSDNISKLVVLFLSLFYEHKEIW